MFTGLFVDAFILTPYVEQTKSEMVWNIANGAGANASPNILSELTFQDVKSLGYGIKIAHLNALSENIAFYVEAEYADSSVKSGAVQDSDYLGDNRTGEFSRSVSEVKDDTLNSWGLAAGIKTRWFGARGHYLTILLGVLGIFPRKRTKTSGSSVISGLSEGITFPELAYIHQLRASAPQDPVTFHSIRSYRYP